MSSFFGKLSRLVEICCRNPSGKLLLVNLSKISALNLVRYIQREECLICKSPLVGVSILITVFKLP
jgi:hypothetical protein